MALGACRYLDAYRQLRPLESQRRSFRLLRSAEQSAAGAIQYKFEFVSNRARSHVRFRSLQRRPDREFPVSGSERLQFGDLAVCAAQAALECRPERLVS